MTRQIHLNLCYICWETKNKAVILIFLWDSKGNNNLALATTVEKLTIRKIVQEPWKKFKNEKKITTPSNRACILYLGCTSFSTIKLILRRIMTHFHFLTIPRLILEFPLINSLNLLWHTHRQTLGVLKSLDRKIFGLKIV